MKQVGVGRVQAELEPSTVANGASRSSSDEPVAGGLLELILGDNAQVEAGTRSKAEVRFPRLQKLSPGLARPPPVTAFDSAEFRQSGKNLLHAPYR